MMFILKTLVFCIMLPPALLAFFTGAAVAGFIEGWKRSPIGRPVDDACQLFFE